MYYKCDLNPSFSAEGYAQCDSWTVVDISTLAADIATELSLNTPLPVDDFNYYWGVILMVFVTAFSAKMIRRILGY